VDATKIGNGTVTDTEFQYINTLGSNAQDQLDAKLDLAGGTMEGSIAMSAQKITGLADPTADQDGATKAYVDSLDINYWSATTDGSISPSGSTTNVEIGGNFIADGSSNDLDLRSGGNTNILLRGRGNQISYIGNNSSTAKVGIGTVSPNERLTVVGNISASTSMLTPVVSATTLTVEGNTFISGDTFYEGALSGSGSISTVGNIYSANHDVLAGSSFKYSDLDDGFYGMPPNAGWSNTSWGNSKTNGASGLGSASQQIGITLPYKAILVGVKGVFRSTETGNYRFALWTAVLADDVATGTWSETITTDNINVLTGGRPFNFSIVDGTTELAAGTQIIPSVFNDTGADNADIFGNYMVIIKRVE
jgi:hypothetical protein